MTKSKGQIEAEISEALIKFEKEYMGRGPEETETYITDDVDGRTRYRPRSRHRGEPGLFLLARECGSIAGIRE